MSSPHGAVETILDTARGMLEGRNHQNDIIELIGCAVISDSLCTQYVFLRNPVYHSDDTGNERRM